MSKKRSQNQRLEAKSKGELCALLSDWIVNELSNDFGFDFEVRITDITDNKNQKVSDLSFYIQLKSTTSDTTNIYHDLNVDDLELFHSQVLPVVLIKYYENENTFYWDIIQLFVLDTLVKDDSNWKMKKFKRLKLTKKLDNLKLFREKLIESQKRINRYQLLNLGIADGIKIDEDDLSELVNHKNKNLLEYKALSLVEAEQEFKKGAQEKGMKILFDIYKTPNDDEYKLRAIVGLIFEYNILIQEENKTIFNLSEEGIELAKKIGKINFENFIIIRQNEAILYFIIKRMSQLLLSKKIQDNFDEKIFSLFYDQEIQELNKIHQEHIKNINDSLKELLMNKCVYEYILALSSIVDIVTYQIVKFAIFDENMVAEEEKGRSYLISECELIIEKIEDPNILISLYKSLANYYYWICKTDKAIEYLTNALKIAENYNDIGFLQSNEPLLSEIKSKPNPYKKKETKPIDEMSGKEYQEFAKQLMIVQGINLDKNDNTTNNINIALKDMDPTEYLKHCKNLRLSYITSPFGKSIGLASMGSKIIWCKYKGSIEGFDLNLVYNSFRTNNCLNCEYLEARENSWSCNVKFIKNLVEDPEFKDFLTKYFAC